MDDDTIKATILYHLRRKKVMGGVHTHFDTIKKGIPSHLGKDITKLAKQMIREGLLVAKPAAYGLQVSLNKERLEEIDSFIKRILGFAF